MPVGAILGAVGSIGGAIIGGSSQKSATKQANQAQQEATQAQLQLGQESLAQNRAIYNSNYNTLSPFVGRGNVAGDSINALLGLPAAPQMASPLAGNSSPAPTGSPTQNPTNVQYAPVVGQTPVPTQNTAAPRYGGFAGALMTVAQRAARMGGEPMGLPTAGPQANGDHIATGGLPQGSHVGGNPLGGTPTGATGGQTGGGAGTGAGTPTTPAANALSATDALHNFANSAGMQFQLQQGENALNHGYAARGMLQSGAALKGISDYAQQTALNNYLMPYMGLLGQQQAVGAGAASSIAGVGQNFGNTVANINNSMGQTIQNGANSASNAALARGAANANMWSGIGSSLGSLAGSFFPHPGYGG